MSEFLKLAYELIAKIVYNISEWVLNFVRGFLKVFITGWTEYKMIVHSYFPNLSISAKILAVILIILLIAIPVTIIALIVRGIIIYARVKADGEDNVILYREIGRLNKQVLELMDEKSRIMSMKVGTRTNEMAAKYSEESGGGVVAGGTVVAGGAAGSAVINGYMDPFAEGTAAPVMAAGTMGVMGGGADGDSIASAAVAAAAAAANAKSKAEEELINTVHRFPKLSMVDDKYANYDEPIFEEDVTLDVFVERFRKFSCSQLHLYYTPEIIRRFVAGLASSHILILEGISGTGKTSLPYSFSRFLGNPATMVSVQPSYRDRSELLGYFNEFAKKFNETEFLRALYEANYREDPTLIVLDEMNLARIEYYFAEMLSVLEMPDKNEWIVDLVPTAWPGDPELMDGGKINVSPRTWFIGTANSDDSTFTITDKVYDRAMPIELNQKADAFDCDLEPRCCVTAEYLQGLFDKAKEEYPITEGTMAKMVKMDNYLQTRFKLAFGNRIMKQMYDFIPVYVACGGTEMGGLDYILARKVLKKFESMNVSFVRDEIKNLLVYIDKIFGKGGLPDSTDYLTRIQNMY